MMKTRRCRSRRAAAVRSVVAAVALFLAVFAPAFGQAPPLDGFWNVQGRGIPGMRCADWMVKLAVEQGRLTGVVGVSQGNVIIQNLVLRPDGSFSGSTQAGHVNARAVRAYQVRGQFIGNLVTVTLSNEICPDRSGSARRQWTGY
jgi:hypothetical protein